MALINVAINLVDKRGKSSTIRVPIEILAGGLAAIPAIVKRVVDVVSKLVIADIRGAQACVEVDVSSLWATNQPADDTVGANPQVNEKALFAFRTGADGNGRSYPMTITLPAVNDNLVFVDGSDTADLSEAAVADWINLMTSTQLDLSSPSYGGAPTDSFLITDSRGLPITDYVASDRTWGNRRK